MTDVTRGTVWRFILSLWISDCEYRSARRNCIRSHGEPCSNSCIAVRGVDES
jgi:hypothetical protein